MAAAAATGDPASRWPAPPCFPPMDHNSAAAARAAAVAAAAASSNLGVPPLAVPPQAFKGLGASVMGSPAFVPGDGNGEVLPFSALGGGGGDAFGEEWTGGSDSLPDIHHSLEQLLRQSFANGGREHAHV